ELDGLVRAAAQERVRATEALQRSSTLSGEGQCPLCGQALGDAFEQVQVHRATELADVEARAAGLIHERARLARAAEAAVRRAQADAARLRQAQAAWTTFERARARRAEAERALAG